LYPFIRENIRSSKYEVRKISKTHIEKSEGNSTLSAGREGVGCEVPVFF
jgi:hypothetical protein